MKTLVLSLTFSILCGLLPGQVSWAGSHYLSAKRGSADHFKFLEASVSSTEKDPGSPQQKTPSQYKSKNTPGSPEKLKLSSGRWQGSQKSLQTTFERVRDAQVLTDSRPQMLRRPTWLYPDDGCFARAEVITQEIKAQSLPAPAKIFAFGQLTVNTSYSPSGKADWWYHVVVGYNVGGAWLVFDPSIDFFRPLALKDWIDLMGGNAEIAVCESTAIDPDSFCKSQAALGVKEAYDLETPFLDSEWDRLIELDRNPRLELGDEPPWLAKKETNQSTH